MELLLGITVTIIAFIIVYNIYGGGDKTETYDSRKRGMEILAAETMGSRGYSYREYEMVAHILLAMWRETKKPGETFEDFMKEFRASSSFDKTLMAVKNQK